MIRTSGLCFSLLAGSAAAARAQVPTAAALDSGTAIRLILSERQQVAGRLLAPLTSRSATARLCPIPGAPCDAAVDTARAVSVPLSSMLRLDVQRGNHAMQGGVIGAGAGFLVGITLGSLVDALCESSTCEGAGTRFAVAMTLGGGTIGVLWGVGIPRWGRLR